MSQIAEPTDKSLKEPAPTPEVKVTPEVTPAPEVKQEAPATKPDLKAVQVDTKPEEVVDFSDFLTAKEVNEKPVVKPVVPPKDEKKEAALETKPPVVDKKEEVKQEPIKQEEADKRDYNDLPEELRPIAKKLHNEPFNAFKKIVKENTELKAAKEEATKQVENLKKGALPENYYEHQRGYTLTPEFESAANTAIKAEMVANHWKTQLDRVRKGETTYQDIAIDPRTGNFVLSDPMQVTAKTEDKIAEYADWAQNQYVEKQYAVRNVAENHTARHKQSLNQVQDFENTAFKNFNGEKAKEWEPIVRDTILKTFPAVYHNNPLASGYAKALITIQQLGKIVEHLQKNGGKAPEEVQKTDDGKIISLEDKKKAGPTNADLANAGAGAKKASDEEVTYDDFQKFKHS